MSESSYRAPLEDSLFILSKVLGWEKLFAYPEFAHVDDDLARAVLTEGARFSAEVLGPVNAIGDQEGSRLVEGRVKVPEAFREAYELLKEAGWIGLDMPEKYGGQNLPLSIQVAFAEMMNGACMSLGMLPVMQRAGSVLISAHADAKLTDQIVPKLVSGEWAATICITEAQAGSDVGRILTMATPEEDGRYRLTGSKMFITFGDHDLTQQIIHLVLARTPDAPAGTRGISLFLVPRLDLESAESNHVSVSRVEKKMGLKGSPTCVLELDGALAYRVGEEMRGLQCMFTMVNMMRLEVSIQGPAIAWAACRKAEEYAAERLQGGRSEEKPVAIVEHADVRRMLLMMRCRTEAMRALVFETAFNLDIARAEKDPSKATEARKLAEFLLPVCKAAGSQTGFDVASLALQVFGGHGYIHDTGVEQYLRDVRVSMIYEGTNGIQALDLVLRKLLRDDGERYSILVSRIKQDISVLSSHSSLNRAISELEKAMESLQQATSWVQLQSRTRPRDVEAAAADYLMLVALVAGGWMWLRMLSKLEDDGEGKALKGVTGRFYFDYYMPESDLLLKRIKTGSKLLDELAADSFYR